MKVSREKYQAIKNACKKGGNLDKIAAKFGVSCTTARRIRGSLNYEVYKSGMKKKGSLPTAVASGKKKAGSSSSTTKTSDKPKSNLNKDNKTAKKGEWKESPNLLVPANTKFGEIVAPIIKKIESEDDVDEVKEKLDERESSLVERHDALIHDYISKSTELDSVLKRNKIAMGVAVLLLVGLIISIIL